MKVWFKHAGYFCLCPGIFLGGLTFSCTSGNDQNTRNTDIFGEASRLSFPAFTSSSVTFDGSVQGLKQDIDALGVFTEQAYAGTNATIEGIVSIPSDYGVAIGTTPTGCDTTDFIFARSFLLQDANAGILIAYGKEPPSQDTAQSASATYITNSRRTDMAVFGDRIRLTVTRVQKYGAGANFNGVVKDFDVTSLKVISSRNSVPYTGQSGAFSRAADLYKVRRLEGYVTQSPSHLECLNSSGREFQFNFQGGYQGILCTGATSYADAQTCTGGKVPYNFQLSYNLGAGTLSGFDTGNSFSYNISAGAKVRITGPVFPPKFNQSDATGLFLMLDQKYQVENLR